MHFKSHQTPIKKNKIKTNKIHFWNKPRSENNKKIQMGVHQNKAKTEEGLLSAYSCSFISINQHKLISVMRPCNEPPSSGHDSPPTLQKIE